VGGEHEDFDVEAWNRRFDESPSGPIGRPRTRTRRPAPPEEPVDPYLDETSDDLFADPRAGTDAVAEEGFPSFEHGQWTVEGEIERFGAFGRGVARAQGWRRAVAVALLVLLVLPLVLQAVQIAARLVS
jgi:hypothetical protein